MVGGRMDSPEGDGMKKEPHDANLMPEETALWLDGRYWRNYFERVFCRQIAVLAESLENRLLPTFDSIAKEAEAISDEKWVTSISQPGDPDGSNDLGDLAERAMDAGIEYCEAMDSVRQGFLNLTVVMLWHLFEQQVIFFLRWQVLDPDERDQVLDPDERDKVNLLTTCEFKKRITSGGIALESLSSWCKLKELKMAANAVKHGEGRSAKQLRTKRPDLFVAPGLEDWRGIMSPPASSVYMPAAGEDIYLTVDDLRAYAETLQTFWREFGIVAEEHSMGSSS